MLALPAMAASGPEQLIKETIDKVIDEIEQEGDPYKSDPQGVYETLRPLLQEPDVSMRALQHAWRAMRALNLPLAAEHTARQAAIGFPHSHLPARMLTSSLLQRNAGAEALHSLARPGLRRALSLERERVNLLYLNERYTEAEARCRAA